MPYAVVVCGRNRKGPEVVHERIESAILEGQRLRLIESNLDRTTWIVEIKAVLPPEIPKSGSERGIRE